MKTIKKVIIEPVYVDLLEENFSREFAESFHQLDSKKFKIVKVVLK